MRFVDLVKGEVYTNTSGNKRRVLSFTGKCRTDILVWESVEQSAFAKSHNISLKGSINQCTYKSFCEWLALPGRDDGSTRQGLPDFEPASFKADLPASDISMAIALGSGSAEDDVP